MCKFSCLSVSLSVSGSFPDSSSRLVTVVKYCDTQFLLLVVKREGIKDFRERSTTSFIGFGSVIGLATASFVFPLTFEYSMLDDIPLMDVSITFSKFLCRIKSLLTCRIDCFLPLGMHHQL